MLLILFCCTFFIHSFGVLAITDEQKAMIHSHFEMLGKECIKDNHISADDIKNLRAKTIPSGENAPCFLACMFRKLGIMDDAGLLQKETVLDLAKKVFNDEDELKLIEDYLHSCSHINTESVSDGDKGCDRSMMAYKCMIENASQFGIEM
uniref:Odorant binding protein 9 n=1 Tax=Heliconius charithonia TaxID=33434 RepID=A0AA49EZV4_HELCH|nr:odorant binding protein 9 [Heliconius charithonia]